MKKLIFSTYDSVKNPYFGGGGAISIHEIAKRLKNKFKISIISSVYPKCKDKVIDGIHYKFIGISTFSPQMDQFIFSLCLPFYILTKDFDVWVESFTPPFSTNFLQLFTKKPVVGLVHMLSGEDMKRKYKLPFDLVEKVGLKTYNYFIVNTLSVKSKILKVNPKARIEIAGNGIDKVRNNSSKSEYALYVGRIEINQKGLDLLIKSWKNVGKKLIIAGDGAGYKKLEELITNNGLQNKIILYGKVSGIEKEKLFKNAAFVVVPSRFETFSMSTLEAFAYGLPVVAFDIEGLRWTPQGSSIKVHPFNILSFAKACKLMFLRRSMRDKLGRIGKTYAKKHTWNIVARRYSNYLLKI